VHSFEKASAVTEPAFSSHELGAAALRGSTLTTVGQGASLAIRFVANLIITRLLLPEHFGLMALVNVFAIGLELFSDIGIGPNIIQHSRGEDPRFLDTAWTIQVLRGIALWLVSCALAWPLARLYHQPQLAWLLPVAGFSAVFGGLQSTKIFTLNRRLAFLRVIAVDVIAQVVSVVVMIGIAWVWCSVWSLVISALAWSALRSLLTHVVLPGPRNRFAWEAEASRAVFGFGRWIFVSTALTFLATQTDRLVLGRLVPVSDLGFYSIASNLAGMPLQLVQRLGQVVFFPIVASAMRQPDHDPASIRRSRNRLLAMLVPLVALGVAMAPPLVNLLYRPAFHAVGPLASYLSIGTWLGSLSTSYTVVLLAAARPKFLSLGLAVKLLGVATLVWFVAPRFGLRGIAILTSLSEVGLLAVSMAACRRLGNVTFWADLGLTAAGAGLVGLFLLLHSAIRNATHTPVLALVVVTALALATTAIIAKRVRLT
jgi:O-antigen/teichoic acid export membrane protein